MNLILVLFIIALAIIGIILEKNVFNFMTIFDGIWAIIVFLSSFELYNMKEVSDFVYVIIFIGVTMFNIGYIIYRIRPVKFVLKNKSSKREYKIRSKKYKTFIIITMLLWLYLTIEVILLLFNGVSYSKIRNIYAGKDLNYSLFSSTYIKTLWKCFAVPAVYVIITDMISSLVIKKYSISYYVYAVIILICYTFVTGSRIILLNIVIQLLVITFCANRKVLNININPKIKKILLKACLCLVVGIIVITVFRNMKNGMNTIKNESLKTYYIYATTTIPLMDHWIEYIDSNEIYGYGGAIINGITSIIKILRLPLIQHYSDTIETLSYCVNTYVPVFGTEVYNAFVSLFFYFYYDFRIIGVMLGSFAFGYANSYMYYSLNHLKNSYELNVILLFSISLIKSFTRFEFAQFDYIIMFLLNRLIYQKQYMVGEKNGEKNNFKELSRTK